MSILSGYMVNRKEITMITYMKPIEIARELGYNTVYELIENECQDSVIPACCSERCSTESDGKCEHGFPSILLECGLI